MGGGAQGGGEYKREHVGLHEGEGWRGRGEGRAGEGGRGERGGGWGEGDGGMGGCGGGMGRGAGGGGCEGGGRGWREGRGNAGACVDSQVTVRAHSGHIQVTFRSHSGHMNPYAKRVCNQKFKFLKLNKSPLSAPRSICIGINMT
jgi:hypothetical protein